MKKVFVVDDSDTNLTKAKEVLTGHFTIITMVSAKKMFSLLEKITPDIILLDIEMPEMSGFEAIERLQANPGFASIPVIFLSANYSSEIETKCYELGAAGFVSKPFTVQGLLEKVKGHIG